MKDDLHIAVFAKAPLPGQVKTRLIPLLGAEGAAAVYRQMALHALHIATAVAPVSLWTAGAADHPFLRECAAQFGAALHAQSDGDLGARMAHCLRQLLQQHRRVLLIGSDCPALRAVDLQQAAAALDHDGAIVLTPAEDGGYVLVGMRAVATPEALQAMFDGIAWSTAAVMSQSRQRLAAIGLHAAEMPQQWDVDSPDDYARAVSADLLPPFCG
jgi:rSAM/selenodomain-associated transferase 1